MKFSHAIQTPTSVRHYRSTYNLTSNSESAGILRPSNTDSLTTYLSIPGTIEYNLSASLIRSEEKDNFDMSSFDIKDFFPTTSSTSSNSL